MGAHTWPAHRARLDARQHAHDTVFAVSNHWINHAKTDGRSYYYSAFSEREVFVEAYDAIRFGIPIGSTGPVERNFVVRQHSTMRCSTAPTSQALSVLTQQYGVRYLFIDRMHGTVDSAVVNFGRIVFSNRDAIIVAVG